MKRNKFIILLSCLSLLLTACLPPTQSNVIVSKVIDGDTLELTTGERVRLICIDTPERGRFYYSAAKSYLTNLTLGKEIILEKDISEVDRYDRLLRYIYLLDGTFVNAKIAEQGYGRVYPYPPDVSKCNAIQASESIAKVGKVGIWTNITGAYK